MSRTCGATLRVRLASSTPALLFRVVRLPVFIFFVVAHFFIAVGCSVFSAFFFVRPVALRDEDLIVRGYGRMHTRICEVRLLALAEVFKGP